ncbi:MAG: SpoIIE family protein phosphatase [Coriobacteriia bacterium]|nr:SpoIIE family protein phosphatase [Coriobacteriia bacterium]
MSSVNQRVQQRTGHPASTHGLKKRLLGVIVVVGLVMPIYVLDRLTGLTPDLSGLYLLPVVLVAYWFGMLPGLVVAGVALLAEIVAHPSVHRSIIIVHALTHTATYCFAAFVTARLRSQLRTIRQLEQRRDYDLELARRLQEPVGETYEPSNRIGLDVVTLLKPARELGGDFVLVRESVHGLFVCIADISGKGVPAALFAALLQDTVSRALFEADDPEEVVAAVNGRMYDALPAEMFVTMFCCLFSKSALRFVNAGHEPGLLKRPQSRSSMELRSVSGMPLGVREGLRIPASEVPLEEGDIVLLFTDGVTDSTGFARDAQNVRRFFESRRWPTAERAASALMAEAECSGQAQPDDMGVVVVRVPEV